MVLRYYWVYHITWFGYLGHRKYASTMDDLSLRLLMDKFPKFFGESLCICRVSRFNQPCSKSRLEFGAGSFWFRECCRLMQYKMTVTVDFPWVSFGMSYSALCILSAKGLHLWNLFEGVWAFFSWVYVASISNVLPWNNRRCSVLRHGWESHELNDHLNWKIQWTSVVKSHLNLES